MTALADLSTLDTSDLPVALCAALTRSADKITSYRTDPYFRLGARRIAVADALRTTFVVAKPDAIAGRRVRTVLTFLRDNDFEVTAAETFRFTPLLTRELWRYQFNIASWARAEVVDLLLPRSDSLLLVLHDAAGGGLPAAVRLTELKGAADPRSRTCGDLRSLLRGPTTLFNFVHTADEPADVARELALFELATGFSLLDTPGRRVAVPDARLSTLVDDLEDRLPAHDLDAASSWRRLAANSDPVVADVAERALASEPAGDWSALLDAFPERRPPDHLLWDVLSIATSEIECNVPGLAPQLPKVDAEAWRLPAVVA